MSAIVFENEIVHFEVLGRGRPVLFLHGWIGSWRYWIPAMQAASTAYRAYALDLWGFGDTAKNSKHYHIQDQVDLLNGFLEQMGILRIALVGHALGAVIALNMSLQFPAKVDRLMLVQFPLDRERLSSRLSADSPRALVEWLVDRAGSDQSILTEAEKTDPPAIQQSLTDLSTQSLKALYQSTLPCLMVLSNNDPVLGKMDEVEEEPKSSNFHTIWFDHSKHFPMLEEDIKFNRLLLDFLSLKSGESPQQLQLKDQWKRRVR